MCDINRIQISDSLDKNSNSLKRISEKYGIKVDHRGGSDWKKKRIKENNQYLDERIE